MTVADEKTFDDYFTEAVEDEDKESQEVLNEEKDETSLENPDEKENLKDDSSFKFTPPNKDKEVDNTAEVDWESRYQELEAELEKERQRNRSWEGRLKKSDADIKALTERVAELQNSRQSDDKSEKTIDPEDMDLQAFLEEFPTFEKPIKALAKKIATQIVQDELGKITPKIEKVETTLQQGEEKKQEDAEATHWNTIAEAHPDYRELAESGAVYNWILEQEKLIKPGLLQIYQAGEASDVIELITRYKQASGIETKSDPPPKKKTTSKKLDSLLAVEAASAGPPPETPDSDDFDSAWEEASKEE